MNPDNFAKIIEAVADLTKTIAWPAVALFIVMYFRYEITNFIDGISEFTFEVAGIKVSAKKLKADVTAALTAAAVASPAAEMNPTAVAKDCQDAASMVSEVVTSRVIRRANRATLLWVDHKPDRRTYERKAFEALGIRFVIATSTDEALGFMKNQKFDAVISNLGRPGDPRAGFTLIEKIRSAGNSTPFVFYSAFPSGEYPAIVARFSAIGFTSRPNDLFKMVVSALGTNNQAD